MSDSGLILGLSWIDLVIILAAIGIGVGGWRMGILRASVALLAIVAGVLLAGMYHERVFVDLAIAEVPSGAMRAASFIVILSLVSVGGYVIGTFLRGVASLLLLGWADRAAGALFGVLFGLLLAQATNRDRRAGGAGRCERRGRRVGHRVGDDGQCAGGQGLTAVRV